MVRVIRIDALLAPPRARTAPRWARSVRHAPVSAECRCLHALFVRDKAAIRCTAASAVKHTPGTTIRGLCTRRGRVDRGQRSNNEHEQEGASNGHGTFTYAACGSESAGGVIGLVWCPGISHARARALLVPGTGVRLRYSTIRCLCTRYLDNGCWAVTARKLQSTQVAGQQEWQCQ
jgi:hypothetical protein